MHVSRWLIALVVLLSYLWYTFDPLSSIVMNFGLLQFQIRSPVPQKFGTSNKQMQSNTHITNLEKHIAELSQVVKFPIDDDVTEEDVGFNVELEKIVAESDRILYNKVYKSFPSALAHDNIRKNRYTNVLPNESTRVKLVKYQTNYINANHIQRSDFKDVSVDYIATQAPTEHTIDDFWWMIYQQRSELILMLTREQESGRVKATRYWPSVGEEIVCVNTVTNEKLVVTGLQENALKESNGSTVHRSFKLQIKDSTDQKELQVDHLLYEDWPDHGVPSQTETFRHLCHVTEDIQSKKSDSSPMTVHCSAGIGRTGTFIGFSIIDQQMKKHLANNNPPDNFRFDIVDVVKKLKLARAGSVQTPEQYAFLYRSVLEQAKELGIVV